MDKRRTYTSEFKAQLVLQMLSGEKSAAQLSREHGIKDSVLSRWRQEFVERSAQVFERGQERDEEDRRVADLERMVGRLTMENDILKKASQWLNSHTNKDEN
jgi:transposase-like protein